MTTLVNNKGCYGTTDWDSLINTRAMRLCSDRFQIDFRLVCNFVFGCGFLWLNSLDFVVNFFVGWSFNEFEVLCSVYILHMTQSSKIESESRTSFPFCTMCHFTHLYPLDTYMALTFGKFGMCVKKSKKHAMHTLLQPSKLNSY